MSDLIVTILAACRTPRRLFWSAGVWLPLLRFHTTLQAVGEGQARKRSQDRIPKKLRMALILGPCSLAPLAQALHKAHWRPGEIEFRSELIFQKALEAEVQRLLLIGEDEKRRRRRFRLRDVVDAHRARFRRGAALQIDVFFEPAIQLRRGDAALASGGDLIDQRINLLRALTGFGGKKHDRRIAKEFQFSADHFFIIEKQ